MLLNRALERTRAEHRVETAAGELGHRFIRHLKLHLLLRHTLGKPLDLDQRDLLDVLGLERVENHDLVDPVQELGAEVQLDLVPHDFLDRFVGLAHHALDMLRTQVRCHDDHRIAEIHGTALAVRQPTVIQNLQQHVEYVRMRFLDLVEQNDAVWLAAHGLGQVAALFVSDVTRRGANQARHRMLFHEFAHVDADHVLVRIKQEIRKRTGQLGLAHAGRAQEQEGAGRA